MSSADPSRKSALVLIAAALIGGGAFVYMVKLMHDMTLYVGQMAEEMSVISANMTKMQVDMASLARDVGDMRDKVASLPGMAADMQEMRASLNKVTGIFGGNSGGDTPRTPVNPIGIIQQMMPAGERR